MMKPKKYAGAETIITLIMMYFAVYGVLIFTGNLSELPITLKVVMAAISAAGAVYAGVKFAKREYTNKGILLGLFIEAALLPFAMFFW